MISPLPSHKRFRSFMIFYFYCTFFVRADFLFGSCLAREVHWEEFIFRWRIFFGMARRVFVGCWWCFNFMLNFNFEDDFIVRRLIGDLRASLNLVGNLFCDVINKVTPAHTVHQSPRIIFSPQNSRGWLPLRLLFPPAIIIATCLHFRRSANKPKFNNERKEVEVCPRQLYRRNYSSTSHFSCSAKILIVFWLSSSSSVASFN